MPLIGKDSVYKLSCLYDLSIVAETGIDFCGLGPPPGLLEFLGASWSRPDASQMSPAPMIPSTGFSLKCFLRHGSSPLISLPWFFELVRIAKILLGVSRWGHVYRTLGTSLE